jgi:hypothetical protein
MHCVRFVRCEPAVRSVRRERSFCDACSALLRTREPGTASRMTAWRGNRYKLGMTATATSAHPCIGRYTFNYPAALQEESRSSLIGAGFLLVFSASRSSRG